MRIKILTLATALLFALPAWADSITSLSGTIHEPGAVFFYNFEVQQFVVVEPTFTFIADVLNGSLVQRSADGCHPCTTTFTNDVFEFLPTETMTLWTFGSNPQWNLVATAQGVSLVDPPTATPEASTLVLLFVAVGYIVLVCKRQRPA